MNQTFTPIRHLKIRVTGKVQGVFYRLSAQRKAQELNLDGYARNRSNGEVQIEVEGPELELEKFVQWCWQGSDMSYVKNVRVQNREVQGYQGFVLK